LVEPIVEKHSFDSHSFAQSSGSSQTLSELALDSATVQIHKLEDELKKVVADRQHWRALATQVFRNSFLNHFFSNYVSFDKLYEN